MENLRLKAVPVPTATLAVTTKQGVMQDSEVLPLSPVCGGPKVRSLLCRLPLSAAHPLGKSGSRNDSCDSPVACSIGCEKCATVIAGFNEFHGKPPQADKLGFNTRYCNETWNSKKTATNGVPLANSTLPKEEQHMRS